MNSCSRCTASSTSWCTSASPSLCARRLYSSTAKSVCRPSSLLMSSLLKVSPGMSPRFLSQKIAQKLPEKWMPSTHTKASRRCAKLLLLLIHLGVELSHEAQAEGGRGDGDRERLQGITNNKRGYDVKCYDMTSKQSSPSRTAAAFWAAAMRPIKQHHQPKRCLPPAATAADSRCDCL
eukprot:GHRQ01015970.1.p2 GENE.GHRQ01015970.1~~GHRQ01015970.1.p2  ORF type:complete len:178 (+),score=25.20 GHRQ01015970.1:474-1007(+)